MNRRSFRLVLGLAVAEFACLPLACGVAAERSTEAVYAAVLAEISSELQLSPPILIHPLLGGLDREAEGIEPMREFLVWDSAIVPAVVERNPGSYRLCEVDSVGTCAAGRRPWLVLSEIHEVGADAAVVVVLVRDPGSDQKALQMYRARVGYRSRGGVTIRIDPIR